MGVRPTGRKGELEPETKTKMVTKANVWKRMRIGRKGRKCERNKQEEDGRKRKKSDVCEKIKQKRRDEMMINKKENRQKKKTVQ